MFNPDELRMIISGTHQTVDIADLRKHTKYAGGYYEEEDAIRWFWEIMEDFGTEVDFIRFF
jgi:ubiquitin-protein ligase E3 C